MQTPPSSNTTSSTDDGAELVLRIYLSGLSGRSKIARTIAQGLCDEYPGATLEVVDVLERPDLAEKERVLATPTLVRVRPLPQVRLVGDMSDEAKVRRFLDLEDRTPPEHDKGNTS